MKFVIPVKTDKKKNQQIKIPKQNEQGHIHKWQNKLAKDGMVIVCHECNQNKILLSPREQKFKSLNEKSSP